MYNAPRIHTQNHEVPGVYEYVQFTVDSDDLRDNGDETSIYMPSVNIIIEDEAWSAEELKLIEAYKLANLCEIEFELIRDANKKWFDISRYNKLTA